MPDSTIFQRGTLPERTDDLIRELDRDYPPVTVKSTKALLTLESQLELAERIGKRQLIDTLKNMLQRKPEPGKEP